MQGFFVSAFLNKYIWIQQIIYHSICSIYIMKLAIHSSFYSALFSLIVAVSLIGCSNKKVDRTDFIPSDASVVLKLNSKALFNDAMLDFVMNMDLQDKMEENELVGVMKDPGSIGVEQLGEYYFFMSGKDMATIQGGVVLPLSSAEKFRKSLEEDGEEITEESGISSVQLSANVVTVWNEHTALINFSANGGDLLVEAKTQLARTSEQNIVHSKANFNDLLNSPSHLSLWTSNEEVMQLYKFAQSYAAMFGMRNLPALEVDAKDSYSLFTLDFNDGEIATTIQQTLNATQEEQYAAVTKGNNVTPLLEICESDKPLAWASFSINVEGVIKNIEQYDGLLAKADQNLMGLTSVKEIAGFLGGDFFVAFNGMTKQNEMVFSSRFNDETGEYETSESMKESNVPFATMAIALTDQGKLEEKMAPLLAGLEQDESGTYNYKNEFFLTLKNNVLYLGSSSKAMGIPEGAVKLNDEHAQKATNSPSALFCDVDNLIQLFSSLETSGRNDKAVNIASSYLNDFYVWDYQKEGNVTKQNIGLTFQNDENALVQLLKMSIELSDLKKNQAL